MTDIGHDKSRASRVGRLIALIAITIILEYLAVALGPEFATGKKGPHYSTLMITIAPLVWALFFLAISDGAIERVVACVALAVACVIIYHVNGLAWEPLERLLRPKW